MEQAAAACDWLQSVCIKEDASFFSYTDRWALIEQGIAALTTSRCIPGSAYMISRATFPGYFPQRKGLWTTATSQIDLQPSVNIWLQRWDTHRFVGSEPFCPLTCAYNQRMTFYTIRKRSGPAVEVVELARVVEKNGVAISASRVRKLHSERTGRRCALVPVGTGISAAACRRINTPKPYDVTPLTRNITNENH